MKSKVAINKFNELKVESMINCSRFRTGICRLFFWNHGDQLLPTATPHWDI